MTYRRSAAAEEASSPDTPEEPSEAFGRAPSAAGLESVPLPEGITLSQSRNPGIWQGATLVLACPG